MEELELAKNGDKEVFEKIVSKIKLPLYKTAMAILKNDDDVCDAIQETLISIYNNIATLENTENFKTWAIRIVINKSYDIIRKNKKVTYLYEKAQTEQEQFYEMYIKDSQLENILNKLEEDLKMVIVLYYYDDISISDISDILNIPKGTVKSRLSRARNKIYEILKKEGEI